MKKILIDTNSINGRRSALIEGDKLIDFDLEFEGNNFQKGSIHKGKVTKIEGSLEAIFVELGSSRHGFLPFKELSAEYFDPSKSGDERFKIKEGDDIVIQIQKKSVLIKAPHYHHTSPWQHPFERTRASNHQGFEPDLQRPVASHCWPQGEG